MATRCAKTARLTFLGFFIVAVVTPRHWRGFARGSRKRRQALARRGKPPADEQAIDAAAFVLAFGGAYLATGDHEYLPHPSGLPAFASVVNCVRIGNGNGIGNGSERRKWPTVIREDPVFDQPVRGPIALGYGAHFGLGLFAALGTEPR